MTEPQRRPRLSAVRRGGARVTNLELFFDLVFVLAVTQCTASIEHDPSWTGVLEALAVLALLWWAWGGYAWLTSLIDPEEGPVRLLMFGAMAATVVASLCIPDVFGDLGLAFALAYGVLRVAHLGLYAVGARGDARPAAGDRRARSEHGDRPRACWWWPPSPTAGSVACSGASPCCSTSAVRSSAARAAGRCSPSTSRSASGCSS